MSSSAVHAGAASPNIVDSTTQRRRLHRQNPAVPRIDVASTPSTAASTLRIASEIVSLNVVTLKALQDGWYQTPQVIDKRYEDFQECLTTEERHHVDWLMELSDLGFDNFVAKYVGTLSYTEQRSRILDLRSVGYYSDLADVCIKRYQAAVAHAALTAKGERLEIPDHYNYCKTYQNYVEEVAVQEVQTRHELLAVVRRASSLLNSIRIAMDVNSLDGTTLSALKTKLTDLQQRYPEACLKLFHNSRDLFDASAEHWWEYGAPPQPPVTHLTTISDRLSLNVGTAYPQTPKDIKATLGFVVPTVCLLCCIPIGYAASYSLSEAGTPTDSDFWQLVAGSVMEILSLATLLWPAAVDGEFRQASRVYTWLLAIASIASVPTSIVFYLFVSIRWSIVISFAGNAAQVLVLLQLINCS